MFFDFVAIKSIPKKIKEIITNCSVVRVSLKKTKPSKIVTGNSNSKITSTTESLPLFKASKFANAVKNVITPKISKRIKFDFDSNKFKSFKTNGIKIIEPIIPIKANASTSPIFRTTLCIKKSPMPQKNIAAKAANKLSSINIDLRIKSNLNNYSLL